MTGELDDHHLGQQPGGRNALVDDLRVLMLTSD
jgi:hypothetical protein